MKPYYEHAGITIYHGDCREVLPTVPICDLLLTDPPYGMSYRSSYRNESFDFIAGDESTDMAQEGLKLAVERMRGYRHGYVFGRFNFSSLPISEPVELVWDKEHATAGDLTVPWAKEHEYIQFFVVLNSAAAKANGRGNLAARLRRGTVLRYSRTDGQTANHPTEKPIALLRDLIECSSMIGDMVLDCFMGSGPTIEAAKIEGRRAIGIEIEEKYCEIAAKRLSQEVFAF